MFREVDGIKKSTTIREEHYSVCSGDGEYLLHFTPDLPSQGSTANECLANDKNIVESCIAMGADSINVNTG